jgi:hypothetical protein
MCCAETNLQFQQIRTRGWESAIAGLDLSFTGLTGRRQTSDIGSPESNAKLGIQMSESESDISSLPYIEGGLSVRTVVVEHNWSQI